MLVHVRWTLGCFLLCLPPCCAVKVLRCDIAGRLLDSDNDLPSEGAGLADGASEASAPAAADEGAPPPLGAQGAGQDLHVGPEAPPARAEVHLGLDGAEVDGVAEPVVRACAIATVVAIVIVVVNVDPATDRRGRARPPPVHLR